MTQTDAPTPDADIETPKPASTESDVTPDEASDAADAADEASDTPTQESQPSADAQPDTEAPEASAQEAASAANEAPEAAEATPTPQAQPAPPAEERAMIPPLMILYDGECGLCHGAVRALMDADRYGAFHYAPLQGETTEQLRAKHPGRIPEDLESVVFVEGDRVHLRTSALIHAARYLPWPWRLAWWLRIIPTPIADLAYDAVASIRYQVFGKKDLCELPAPDVRQRFLP